MKICFKMNEILDFNLIVSFDLYEHVLATSLEKQKTNFPHLYSWSSLHCHYGISNILLHHQNVLPRNPEISVKWFLLKSVLKQMWAQGWQGKQKERRIISAQRWKVLSISLKLWTNGSGNEEQCLIMQGSHT